MCLRPLAINSGSRGFHPSYTSSLHTIPMMAFQSLIPCGYIFVLGGERDFRGECMTTSGWDIGILNEGGEDNVFENVHVGPFNVAGMVSIDAKRTKASNLSVDSRNPFRNMKIGRNVPCPCGSGDKYKRCHGAIDMGSRKSTGIISVNSSGTFTDTTVIVESGGTGIYREDDRTDFVGATVLVGQNVNIAELISALKLPADTPHAFMTEAIDQVRESGDAKALSYSKLRMWLLDNGFDMKCWAETAIGIGAAALG